MDSKRGKFMFQTAPVSKSRRVFLLGSMTALLSIPLLARAKALSLTINYYDDFAPLSFMAADGSVVGIFKDIMEETLGRRGKVSLLHSGLPWARAQQEVKDGQVDAFCTLATEARRVFIDFSKEPMVKTFSIILFAKNNPKADLIRKITTLDDLKQFTVGTFTGNSRIDSVLKGINLDLSTNVSQVLMKIAAGRIDITTTPNITWKYYARQLGVLDKLEAMSFEVAPPLEYHLGIRKSHPAAAEIMEIFNKTFATARKDGAVDRIIASYG